MNIYDSGDIHGPHSFMFLYIPQLFIKSFVKYTRPLAKCSEISTFAKTNRKIQAVSPLEVVNRMPDNRYKTYISLRIGNKIINFYKDSGILDTTCATMYEEKVLRLPGGFSLPITLIRQTAISSSQVSSIMPTEGIDRRMQSDMLEYLDSQIVSGDVLHKDYIASQHGSCYFLQGNYICEEMIGKYQVEKRLPNNG